MKNGVNMMNWLFEMVEGWCWFHEGLVCKSLEVCVVEKKDRNRGYRVWCDLFG